jgi:CYTH domain-containing protein
VSSWKRRGLSAIGPRVDVDIVQAYTPQRGERIRRRTVERIDSYFHTVKYPIPKGGNVEYERLIGEDEFDGFVGRYDLSERFLAKRRHSFVANGRHFELDVFEEGGLVLLECELPSMDEEPVIPRFISIDREVTNDPRYSNYEIWKRQFA